MEVKIGFLFVSMIQMQEALSKALLPFYWSDYYRENKRDPSNNQLAPWVNQFYKAL